MSINDAIGDSLEFELVDGGVVWVTILYRNFEQAMIGINQILNLVGVSVKAEQLDNSSRDETSSVIFDPELAEDELGNLVNLKVVRMRLDQFYFRFSCFSEDGLPTAMDDRVYRLLLEHDHLS